MAQKLYKSDEYKEYEEFKKEMNQFKQDAKDHMSNIQNPVVQTSISLFSMARDESQTAKAIRQMRDIQPGFNVHDFEDDAKGIFEMAYVAYLNDNLKLLEKFCGEQALAFFKVQIKKREADKCIPKYR